jgi:tRNA-dihydrouridine synthase B
MNNIKIGNVNVGNRIFLAPMAAVNCTSFRLLCKENGAGLVYTQMYDCDKILEKSPKEIEEMLNINKKERPIAVQLIGSDEKIVVKAAKLVEKYADIIDFNVGCILDDFLQKGCGGALLKNPEKLELIVKNLVKSVSVPVTCKIRIGWDAQNINAVKICQMLESCGVSCIAIHGRTVEQKYGKKINWTIMKQIKEKVNIPIIANGDVRNHQEALDLLKKTECDFVMIGRESQHSPWIFDKNFELNNDNIKKQILRFIELYEKYENRKSITELTQHIFWMFRDIKTSLRARWIYECKSIQDIKEFLERID